MVLIWLGQIKRQVLLTLYFLRKSLLHLRYRKKNSIWSVCWHYTVCPTSKLFTFCAAKASWYRLRYSRFFFLQSTTWEVWFGVLHWFATHFGTRKFSLNNFWEWWFFNSERLGGKCLHRICAILAPMSCPFNLVNLQDSSEVILDKQKSPFWFLVTAEFGA